MRAISSSDASLSTSSPRRTPQWPCEVYSQRQTSVRSSSSGKRARSARSACWTIPSSIQAPEPSSSFSSGMPKRMHRLHAEAARAPRTRGRPTVDGVPREPGQALVRQRCGRDEERHDEVVERERRLADEVAQRAGAAQPPQAGDGERAHGRRVRAAGGSADSSSTSTGTGPPPARARTRSARRRTPRSRGRPRAAAARSARPASP